MGISTYLGSCFKLPRVQLRWFAGTGLGGAGSLVDGSVWWHWTCLPLGLFAGREESLGKRLSSFLSPGPVLVADLQREMGRAWLTSSLMMSVWRFVA